jgi:murein DD-endopeptidase MepM/ murein hydrolase activator NlpD
VCKKGAKTDTRSCERHHQAKLMSASDSALQELIRSSQGMAMRHILRLGVFVLSLTLPATLLAPKDAVVPRPRTSTEQAHQPLGAGELLGEPPFRGAAPTSVQRTLHVTPLPAAKRGSWFSTEALWLSEAIAASGDPSSRFQWPIDEPTEITQSFGCQRCLDEKKVSERYRQGADTHAGYDLRPRGARCYDYTTPVKAAAGGYVLKVVGFGRASHGLGNTVILRHDGVGLYSLYAHLDTIAVRLGERVERGKKLGIMGNSALKNRDESLGCTHVHFEIKTDGVLGDKADHCEYWGYVPGRPEPFGYIDAAWVIRPDSRRPPLPVVEKGRCPGEGCTLGEWLAVGEVTLYEAPEKRRKVVGTVQPLEFVRVVASEMWTKVPGLAVVKRDYRRFRQGDLVYLLSYHGEGFFSAWHRGDIVTTLVDFSPDAWSRACVEGLPECWGEWKWGPVTSWWIQIRTPSGAIGWTDEADHFLGHHLQYSEIAARFYSCLKQGGSAAICASPVDTLVAELTAAKPERRYGAAVGLLELGPFPKEAVPGLVKLLGIT